MCCFFVSLVFFGPRLAFLVYWLIAPIRVNAALTNLNFPWLVGILGLVFIPWAMLMWVLVYPMNGWDWIWVGLGVGLDIAGYMGGFHKRQQIPGYPSTDPLQNM